MTLPILNMADWSMSDYELAYDGLMAMDYAALGLVNQPRASIDRTRAYRPGADFIACVQEDWIHHRLQELNDRLEQIRFDDPLEDDRRVCLLIRRNAALLAPVVDLVALAERERRR